MGLALCGMVLLPWRADAEADGPATGAVTVKLTTKANHDHIDINTFYHGSTVSVQGDCAPDTDLVIKISAAEGETSLKQKGKVGGLLWMNVGDLHFSRVPGLYLLKSSGNIEEVVAPEEASRYVLGYDALKRHLEVEPAATPAERTEIVGQFIQYNEENKLFARQTGGIEFKNENNKRTYYTVFDWPYQAKPGDYVVDVYAVRDGRVVDTARAPVKVEQAGTVKYLAAMARNNGALYGILSIVVALASGFGAGAIFRKQGGAH
jgi:uncharacterized protein (TIGR02186 family)